MRTFQVMAMLTTWASQAAAPINAEALAKLIKAGQASHSDAVVVMLDGKVVAEEYYGKPKGPIEAMSVTKSIVGLAIGLLIDDGKIRSLDQPVSDFFPEWKQGRKKLITVRHLLTHTSGLQSAPSTEEVYESPDFVQLALAAELDTAPGEVWSYNNKALNLVAGLVTKASGQRLDLFLKERLFAPMGITTATWSLDPAGNPHGMSGLQIEPKDLAKLGQLMLQQGKWEGKALISANWVALSTSPSTTHMPRYGLMYGLLWWLVGGTPSPSLVDDASLSAMREGNVDPALIAKLEPLKGKVAQSDRDANKLLTDALGGEAGLLRYNKEVSGRGFRPATLSDPTGYAARGYLGQYLVVYPRKKLVAVRMYRQPEDEHQTPPENSRFEGFDKAVNGLAH
jgi:CubicO group peptidase (beta-lactamase class C family)